MTLLAEWVANVWQAGEPIQTYALLQRLCVHIHQSLSYQVREEPGVQTPADTLSRGTGSCRDFANLFMEAARHLGLAARFVSGYLHAEPSAVNYGSTHAWAEVFLPRRGLEGIRSHHRQNRGDRSHRCRGGEATRIRAAHSRLVRWASRRAPGCGGMGDRAGLTIGSEWVEKCLLPARKNHWQRRKSQRMNVCSWKKLTFIDAWSLAGTRPLRPSGSSVGLVRYAVSSSHRIEEPTPNGRFPIQRTRTLDPSWPVRLTARYLLVNFGPS